MDLVFPLFRYEVSLEECHYLVDLDTRRETELEPR